MVRRLVGALTAACVLGGCVSGGPSGEATGSSTRASPGQSTTTASGSPSASGGDRRGASLDRALVADLEDVARAHPDAEVSVALAPVGGHERPQVVGDAPGLIAWSTIKVPLSLAVIGEGGTHGADIDAALTHSDNAAAQRLWQSLGAGTQASQAVQRQLRRGGDRATRVPSEVTSPGHSVSGQTVWRLSDQTTFASTLPCLRGSSAVTDAMRRVVDGQRWGLGGIDGARIKGGWGETPDGYIVRQLAILPGTKGETAATLQVRTVTHEQGTAIADEIADVLRRHGDDLPTGTCD